MLHKPGVSGKWGAEAVAGFREVAAGRQACLTEGVR